MQGTGRFAVGLAVLLSAACLARSCPVCNSETGCQVRAGIFNEDFTGKLVQTALPFPVFLAIVAAIHFGFPFCLRKAPCRQPLLVEAKLPEAPTTAWEDRP